MLFPARPTVHSEEERHPMFRVLGPISWEMREDSLRHCTYCGSLHPEDLLRLVDHGARVSGCDWKYGWPHKFYVTTEGDQGIRGLFAKWYNVHIRDEGFDNEARGVLLAKLELHSGIQFFLDGERLAYRAPYLGYQR